MQRHGRGKHRVANLEAGHVFANRLHLAGQFHAVDWISWFCQTQGDSRGNPGRGRNREAAHADIAGGNGSGMHFDQDLVIFRRRFFNLAEVKHVRISVFCCDNCFHFDLFLMSVLLRG